MKVTAIVVYFIDLGFTAIITVYMKFDSNNLNIYWLGMGSKLLIAEELFSSLQNTREYFL